MLSYFTLFLFSFLAATILPFSSEVVLYAMLEQGEAGWMLVIVASVGNTLGAVVNWYLGRYLLHYQDRPWFYFSPAQVDKMQHWFQRYGVWSLLFSWLPLGGDVLTFIAGIMKVRLSLFLILVAIGKTTRYIAVLYFSNWLMFSG